MRPLTDCTCPRLSANLDDIDTSAIGIRRMQNTVIPVDPDAKRIASALRLFESARIGMVLKL
jgi:hypothetical protein